ncbi:hypothetical protein ACQ4PT_046640 [Festuca glaucescens]
MASNCWFLLPLLVFIQLPFSSAHGTPATSSVHCLPDQASSLLQLKQSFNFDFSNATLPSWQDGIDCCLWEGVGCEDSSGQVTALSLRGRGLYSKAINRALFNLTSLHHLDLSGNNFGGSHLPAVGFERLSLLTYLNLSDAYLCGQIPISIGYLTSLLSLDLSTHFGGEFGVFSQNMLVLWEPSFTALVANLTNLRELYLDSVDISASGEDWCNALARHVPHLEVLSLEDCGLSGPIDQSLSRVRSLNVINLSYNHISGAVPDLFADFLSLSVLQLGYCNFGGRIPPRIFQLNNLSVLDVSDNPNMLVHLPDFLNGSSLEILNMQGTNVSTTNPMSFSNLKSLEELSLDGEYRYIAELHPSSFMTLHKLHLSQLGSDSQISWVGDLKKLTNLEIFRSNFSRRAPSWIGNLTSLRSLQIYLISLDLSSNRLQGEIPIPLKSRSLRNQFLDYSNNSFSLIMKNCTSCLSQTTYLKMSNNRISGKIPEFICNTSKLQVLDLSNNSFSGTIPSCLIENGHLGILNLKDNDLEGRLALNIEKGCALQTINLNGNRIEGHLPRSLTNCKDLEFLDMGNNQIVDSFPYWLGKLPKLRVLVLRSNQLHGSIGNPPGDDNNEQFSSLHIIDVASNNLSGNLTSQWFEKFQSMIKSSDFTGDIMEDKNLSGPYGHYQDIVTVMFKGQYITFQKIWTTLAMIDLSDNALRGGIPESVGELSQLHGLNLSHNTLTGEIPPALGSMTNLESLDLSSNELSGKIPEELTNLTSLGTLNLSNNQLMGKIPETRQFGTFQNNSYFGNKGLCGAPLFIQCGSTDGPVEARRCNSSGHVDVILFLFVGLGFGFGFAAAILMKWRRVGEWYKTVVTSRG